MAHQWDEVLAELLETAPELTEPFKKLKPGEHDDYRLYGQQLSAADAEYLRSIEATRRKPTQSDEPGLYIVFEDLLRPYIATLAQGPNKADRLRAIMQWVEQLANSDDSKVTTLVAVALCEGFITNEVVHIKQIFPFMGTTTRKLCIQVMPAFKVSAETKRLFGVK